MQALDEAIKLWESARGAYEDSLGAAEPDGERLEELRQSLYAAELAVDAVVAGLTEGLGAGTAKVLASLQAGIAAQIRIQEHRAVEAERSARHGELAGAGHAEREAIGRFESAAEALSDLATSLREVVEGLSER